jgi:hypothetical protein
MARFLIWRGNYYRAVEEKVLQMPFEIREIQEPVHKDVPVRPARKSVVYD